MTKLLLAVLLVCANAYAGEATWPGGIAFIDLGLAKGTVPAVEYNGKRILVTRDDGRWRAAVGVPLDTPAGTEAITMVDGTQHQFDVAEHAYREQHLTVAPGISGIASPLQIILSEAAYGAGSPQRPSPVRGCKLCKP